MNDEPAKILIADDHALFREGLRELIGHWRDFQLIGEVENGKQAIEFCRQSLPEIILMDVHMPEMDGIKAAWCIREEFPSVRIIMLTMSVNEDDLFEAIKVGAQGYVLKDVHARQLHNILRGVLQGDAHLSGPVAAKILTEFNQRERSGKTSLADEENFEAFTEREIQIMQLIVDGFSNTEIGEKLYLSEQTIKKEITEIMQKLHLKNRVQIAAYTLRKGLAK
jgi:two-component system, NarL family, response regulator LiaR